MRKCAPGCSCGHHTPFSEKRLHNISIGKRTSVKWNDFVHGEQNRAHLRQLADRNRGRLQTEEQRRKISERLRGRALSEEHRRKVSEANRNPELKAQRRVARIARRKPPETYRQVHKRLVTDRGSASGYLCVDCDEPAQDWSHDCLVAENLMQEIRGKRLIFSTDLSVYQPRCKPCHNRLDAQTPPWRQ